MNEALTLQTENPDVVLRLMSDRQDDAAFFEAVEEDRGHLCQNGNDIGRRYLTVDDVTSARETAQHSQRFGIWDKERFVGGINASMNPRNEAEVVIGYWLRKSAIGHGYASMAVRALTASLREHHSRIFAEIHLLNKDSMRVMQRTGYRAEAFAIRKWGPAIVFEASD